MTPLYPDDIGKLTQYTYYKDLAVPWNQKNATKEEKSQINKIHPVLQQFQLKACFDKK